MENGRVVRAHEREGGLSHGNYVQRVSTPQVSGAERLVIIDAAIAAGGNHGFHRHPQQEEVLYVLEGEIEQWLEETPHVLTAGDSMLVKPGTVHATFNRSQTAARLLAITSPCIGEAGAEVVSVEEEEPWATHMRSRL